MGAIFDPVSETALSYFSASEGGAESAQIPRTPPAAPSRSL